MGQLDSENSRIFAIIYDTLSKSIALGFKFLDKLNKFIETLNRLIKQHVTFVEKTTTYNLGMNPIIKVEFTLTLL